jgi:hypothetical protein
MNLFLSKTNSSYKGVCNACSVAFTQILFSNDMSE